MTDASARSRKDAPDNGLGRKEQREQAKITGTEDGRMELTMGRDGKCEFKRTADADAAHSAIDSALDLLDAGRASAEVTEGRLQETAAGWPANIEAARAHGVSLDAIGATHRAHKKYRRAFGLAETALGNQKVEFNWYVFMNRPFLRAGAAMVHVLREERKPAHWEQDASKPGTNPAKTDGRGGRRAHDGFSGAGRATSHPEEGESPLDPTLEEDRRTGRDRDRPAPNEDGRPTPRAPGTGINRERNG